MRVSKEILNNYGLFNNLPEDFKRLSGGDYFVFYYGNDEENLKLKIYEYAIVKNINVSLYRDMDGKIKKHRVSNMDIGCFSGTSYETRDGIFFLFLRTYNDADKVSDFYKEMVVQDTATAIDISTGAVTDVYTQDDFRRSISYFCANRIQTIMFIYDMVAGKFWSRASKSLLLL